MIEIFITSLYKVRLSVLVRICFRIFILVEQVYGVINNFETQKNNHKLIKVHVRVVHQKY